jgi:hypothetical protein
MTSPMLGRRFIRWSRLGQAGLYPRLASRYVS